MFNSPFIIPLGAFAVAIVAIIGGVISNAHSRRIKADQRMAMLARGIPLADIEQFMNSDRERDDRLPSSPGRRMANSRLTAMILISSGIGIALFGAVLETVIREREILSLCAIGLVPLAIGVGFLLDYRLQARDIAHLGLPIE